jgi:hypothetical protein
MGIRSHFVMLYRLASVAVTTALLVTAFAPAVAAQAPRQATSPSTPSFSTRSIAKVVSNSRIEAPRVNRATDGTPKAAPKQGGNQGFFKTRTGLLVIAVMAIGTGYAIYSAKEDRITGSVR